MIKSLRTTLTAAVMTGTLVTLAPGAGAAPAAPTDRVTVDVASVNGSGCKPGTATVDVASDNSAFTVTYSEYLAQAGGGVPVTEGRKNCQLALNVHVPQGFTYAVSKVDYRGYGNLEQGATGTQKASYYFQGMSQTASRTHTFRGRLNNNWQVTDTTDIEALVYAPCGALRNFNINTELRTTAGTDASKTSYMTVDSTDGTINSVYHFSWKQCPDR